MNYYFKYTNGDAFLLNDENYVGFFNFQGTVAYTDRIYTSSDSLALVPKTTYIADFYKDRMEFDITYGNTPTLTPYYSNVFDVFDTQGITTLTESIDYNNLLCFKGFNIANPTIYNFEKNNNLFYGISYLEAPVVSRQTGGHIEPFTSNTEWAFLDSITTGALFVNSQDEFKYICSTGDVDYVISGSFNHPSVLKVIYTKDLHPDYTTTPDYTHHIHNDIDERKIFVVNNDYIRIYDTQNYDECESLPLLDQISLNPTTTEDHIWGTTHYTWKEFHYLWKSRYHTYNDNNPAYIKFGKNVRTSLSGKALTIVNKYSTMSYQSIDLAQYGVEEVIDLDASSVSDDIIVLYKKSGVFWLLSIYGLDSTNFKNTELKSIKTSTWNKVCFSNVDSNLIYLTGQNEFQSRHLSNPEYPSGRMEMGELLYFKRYKWSEAKEQWSAITSKWNSGKLPANNFNVLTASETIKNGYMYMLLHNVGRLYALKQPVSDYILSIIPNNLSKYFTGVKCSESSLGLYLNSTLSNLIKDTLNLLTKSEGKFVFSEYSVFVDTLTEADILLENLKINGNETINVIALQRILTSISNIQTKLFPE